MKLSHLKEAIRQVVREELREVLREELSTPTPKQQPQEPVFEQPKRRQTSSPKTGNPSLDSLLNETANSEWRSMGHFGSGDAQSFMPQQMTQQMGAPTQATSIDGFMQQNKQAATSPEHVQVNSVPDFSGVMNTMKSKGMV